MKYTMKDVTASYTPEKRKKSSIWARFFSRPISFVVTYIAINLGLTANMVSIISIFEAFIACLFMMIGGKFLPWGVGLFLFWDVLDCTDGNIARIKKNASYVGEYMDAVSGYSATAFIYLSIGVAAFKTTSLLPGKEHIFIVLGGVASISDILSRIIYQKYVVTEYRLGQISEQGNIDVDRSSGIKHIADVIMKNLSFSCLFMPLLVLACIFSYFDILVTFYSLYCVCVLIATFVLFIHKAKNLDIRMKEKNLKK